jgi:hypothetical protein
VVNCGSSDKPVFFPAEVVEIPAGQSVKAKLLTNETSTMLRHACKSPGANARDLENFGRSALGLDDNLLAKFGLSVDKNLLVVHARVLEAPAIRYRTQGGAPLRPRDGSWNMKDVKVAVGSKIQAWSFVQVASRDGVQPLDYSNIDKFIRTSGYMGVDLSQPTTLSGIADTVVVKFPSDRYKLEPIFKQAEKQGVGFLLFVFAPREASSEVYAHVKLLGDCTYGIHTSCMVASKFVYNERAEQYFANVALKWNLKAGGVNHRLSQEIDIFRDGRTMVVGYDVTHPTNMPNSKADAAPSLVGLVSSVDKELGQWPSVTWEQSSKQEMLDNRLVAEFKSCIDKWSAGLPENIVIYRDGVSESQFAQVLEKELPMIREACRQKYNKQHPPKITVVVSVKRHHTRFYPTSEDGETRSGNIKCGTVVDRDVTQARYWDFFLTAHNALQGTARPAHYTVLLDEIFRAKYGPRAADELEKMTHEMCYLFGRATKAISICPPAYYADIVCERARAHRPDHFDESASETTSEVSGSSSKPKQVSIHQRLRNTMYYI